MRINLTFVSQKYDVMEEGVLTVWTEAEEEFSGMPNIGMYPIKSANVIAAYSADDHPIWGSGGVKMRRSDGVCENVYLMFQKSFTAAELQAGEAEINLNGHKGVLLRVVDAQGQPAPNATISLHARGTTPTLEVRTDENGELRMLAQPGEFRVAALGQPRQFSSIELTINANDPPQRVVTLTKP
jgi:hypothetical protein